MCLKCPRISLDFCLFLELCGYSANEPVSKLADGEKQQG